MKVAYVGQNNLHFDGLCFDWDKTSIDPIRNMVVPYISKTQTTFVKGEQPRPSWEGKIDFYDLDWEPYQEGDPKILDSGSIVIRDNYTCKKYKYPMSQAHFRDVFKPYENFNISHVKRLSGADVISQLNEMFEDSNIKVSKTTTVSEAIIDVYYTCKVGEWGNDINI